MSVTTTDKVSNIVSYLDDSVPELQLLPGVIGHIAQRYGLPTCVRGLTHDQNCYEPMYRKRELHWYL